MEERSVHLLDYLAVLKRRRWWLIVPMVLGVDRGRRAHQRPAARVPRIDHAGRDLPDHDNGRGEAGGW